MSNNVSIQTGQPSTFAHVNHCGLTRLPIGDGCTAAPSFWEDCNANGRCEAHLANHINSYFQQLDGLPKRNFLHKPKFLAPPPLSSIDHGSTHHEPASHRMVRFLGEPHNEPCGPLPWFLELPRFATVRHGLSVYSALFFTTQFC